MGENGKTYKKFINDFENIMCNLTAGKSYSNIIFLCIGTQRIIGDAFGPLVGTRLNNCLKNANRLNVIGTLENCISLCNINEIMRNIEKTYTNPFTIAIDAALSTTDNIGKILVTNRRNRIR